MKSLKAVAVILLFCSAGYAEGRTPYTANVTTSAKKIKSARVNSKRKESYEKIGAVTVSGRIHGLGNFSARFDTRKNVTWTSTVSRDGVEVVDSTVPTLLQGSVAVNGSWKMGRNMYPAAASVVGNTATFEFPGKARGAEGRRQRVYRVKFVVGSDDKVTARVSSIPSSVFANKTCETLGHQHSDAHQHGGEIAAFRAQDNEDTVRVATLSTVADPAWHAKYGALSNAKIAEIVNSAETIYERQLGIRFRIVKQHVFADSASYPLTSDIAGDLLAQFMKNPSNPTIMGTDATTFEKDVDLKHLFTGGELYKDLTRTKTTTGIAFTSAFCWTPSYAYGVTKSTLLTSVTFAHEIGHNFGAQHDPLDPNGIMYTFIRPNSYLSATTVSQINSHLATYGSCLSTEKAPANLRNANLTLTRTAGKTRRFARLEGTLTSIQGNPVANTPILLTIGSKTVQTKTNTAGQYSYLLNRRSIRGRVAMVSAQTLNGETQAPTAIPVTKG
jgi:hypothetical protein